MKNRETDYLDKLFASSSDVTDEVEVEVEVPLLDMPDGLSEKLYLIAESAPASSAIGQASDASLKADIANKSNVVSWPKIVNWPKLSSIAASLFIAILGFQFYQQHQTLKQLEQAQSDLATALHYLGEANRITREQVGGSLNENINKAGVVPAMSIGIDAVRPKLKKTKPEKTKPRKTQI